MNRRLIFVFIAMNFSSNSFAQFGKQKSFRIKLKTKSNSIITTTINATDPVEAEYKIKKKYPGCTIIKLQQVK